MYWISLPQAETQFKAFFYCSYYKASVEAQSVHNHNLSTSFSVGLLRHLLVHGFVFAATSTDVNTLMVAVTKSKPKKISSALEYGSFTKTVSDITLEIHLDVFAFDACPRILKLLTL